MFTGQKAARLTRRRQSKTASFYALYFIFLEGGEALVGKGAKGQKQNRKGAIKPAMLISEHFLPSKG